MTRNFHQILWTEGKWLDMWSVIHFLVGLLTAYFFLTLLGIPVFYAFLIAFLLFVWFEVFEYLAKSREKPINQIVDVAVCFLFKANEHEEYKYYLSKAPKELL